MNANVGSFDRMARVFIGLLVIGIGLYFESWYGAIGVVPLLTAFVRFCPAYKLFGVSSCSSGSCRMSG